MKEALLWEKLPDNRVHCYLCAHHCRINEGAKGICKVRKNVGGALFSLTYGRLIAAHVDPIEKKPLYHFLPGSTSYSVATPGCNFRCAWCQNWEISHAPREQDLNVRLETSPVQVVERARAAGCASISYTYTEPTMFFEYSLDVARLARAAGLRNVYVTNGFMSGEMLDGLHPLLDAANVDLKAFRDETYHDLIGGRLQPVLESMIRLKRQGVWVEATTLVIPGVNDGESELRDIAGFLADELGRETPWHISRFFPTYRMVKASATSLDTLQLAAEIGQQAGLAHVYVGNVSAEGATRCPDCGRVALRRAGFTVTENTLADGACPSCGSRIAGVWV